MIDLSKVKLTTVTLNNIPVYQYPRRRRSAYYLFLLDHIAKFKSIVPSNKRRHGVLVRQLRRLWYNMPESERKPYLGQAEKDKERFKEQLNAYLSNFTVVRKPRMSRLRKKAQGLPPRPLNAYLTHLKEKLPQFQNEFPYDTKRELVGKITALWRFAKENYRQPYLENARERRRIYRLDVKNLKLQRMTKKREIAEQRKIERLNKLRKKFGQRPYLKNEILADNNERVPLKFGLVSDEKPAKEDDD